MPSCVPDEKKSNSILDTDLTVPAGWTCRVLLLAFLRVPGPFKNENAAAAANNGSVPPDLTLLTLSREGGADYLMALLTGYCDPPVGEPPLETGYYNPYFEGKKM